MGIKDTHKYQRRYAVMRACTTQSTYVRVRAPHDTHAARCTLHAHAAQKFGGSHEKPAKNKWTKLPKYNTD